MQFFDIFKCAPYLDTVAFVNQFPQVVSLQRSFDIVQYSMRLLNDCFTLFGCKEISHGWCQLGSRRPTSSTYERIRCRCFRSSQGRHASMYYVDGLSLYVVNVFRSRRSNVGCGNLQRNFSLMDELRCQRNPFGNSILNGLIGSFDRGRYSRCRLCQCARWTNGCYSYRRTHITLPSPKKIIPLGNERIGWRMVRGNHFGTPSNFGGTANFSSSSSSAITESTQGTY
mmetsp:Transcript_21071/g.30108  ORF Transcript_21071/g.30108 Transcript_21071/m.30108 type:complete len:227 (+) Transcript_21071:2051-2731(+)